VRRATTLTRSDAEMADDRTLAYAEALFAVARSEGTLGEVEDELFRFSQTLQGNDELRHALTDPAIPASRRQQIIEDLLGGRASSTTVALVSMVVGTGRARELPKIIRLLVDMSAAEANKEVAEVRSAVPLSDDQRARLAKALGEATGKQIEVKVMVDPSVLGGIVAQIGDTVIDGSVRSRLDKLKNAF
jgi:F-type H+-transporting ATPase subunit delta